MSTDITDNGITIHFVGDFIAPRAAAVEMDSALTALLAGADYCAVNFEAPVASDAAPAPKSGPSLSQDAACPALLHRAGFNVFPLANNHIMDYGAEPALHTGELLAKGGQCFGLGRGSGAFAPLYLSKNGITVADDYAHHPTELAATLKAAKGMDYKRVIAVFQPFTFSRTVQHLEEFRDALEIADIAVLTDIMGSREKNTYGIYTRNLAEIMHNAVFFPQDETAEYTDERKYQNFEDVCKWVLDNAQPGDLILTMGCGDINKVAKMIVERL